MRLRPPLMTTVSFSGNLTLAASKQSSQRVCWDYSAEQYLSGLFIWRFLTYHVEAFWFNWSWNQARDGLIKLWVKF